MQLDFTRAIDTYNETAAWSAPCASRQRLLGQWPTPLWFAEALVERYFPDLDSSDLVLEPTAGPGRFLQAIPAHVGALGIEIDPAVADFARTVSGRDVLVGDVRTIQLAVQPTAIIGNPPFEAKIIEAILRRAHEWLPEGGRAGFILPAYVLQNTERVLGLREQWSMTSEMIPRSIYPRLTHPLVFGVFSKDRNRTLVGFALFDEVDAVHRLSRKYREILEGTTQGRSAWRHAAQAALRALGGEASLQEIYRVMESKRPTANNFWRDRVRETLQDERFFRRTARGRFALGGPALN